MGDPVGNFHYVEKRLKQGITVSKGGEGGGTKEFYTALPLKSLQKIANTNCAVILSTRFNSLNSVTLTLQNTTIR